MRRRTVLAGAATLVAGLAACSAGRPDVRLDSSVGVLHPGDERFVDSSLRPEDAGRRFAAVAPDDADALLGPDASEEADHWVRNEIDGDETFLVVAQLRTDGGDPKQLLTRGVAWRGRQRLRLRATAEPWGSFEDLDEDRRDALESADELAYTVFQSLEPRFSDLPDEVELSVRSE